MVIPAYNEEIRILPTIGAVASHVSELGFEWDLIVSDDGSTDRTVSLVSNLGLPNARVIPADRNRGKGAAVRTGMLAARGDYVLFCDADFSTPIVELGNLLQPLVEDRYDVAVGSRVVVGAVVENRSAARKLISSGMSALVRTLGGLKISDTQCGFKLFNRQAAHTLFEMQSVDGFAFDLEILHLAARLGFRVVEVPVHWYEAPFSKVDPVRDSVRVLGDAVRIRWRLASGNLRADNPDTDRVAIQ